MLLSVSEFIGRFHPVLVHLPIGVLLLALVLQWVSVKPGYMISMSVMKLIWWTGIIAAFLSCITGYLLSLDGAYESDAVNIHMWLGIAVAALSLLLASKIFTGETGIIYKSGSVLLFLLVMLTGHFGGALTHGSDYLTSGLSGTEDEATEEIRKPIANIQESNVYGDVIQPMLSSKCYSCHNAKKQKGKLRLDTPEFILKGGKNGEVIINGNPKESELVKRLLLPQQEDHHMPPKQKPQLKEGQINLIYWWIEQGADFEKKVKDLQQPDRIKTLLTSLENKSGEEKPVIQLIPGKPVERADEKALAALKEKGVIIMPVAQGSNYLMANFVTASGFNDSDAKLLVPLKKQLIALKAGGTLISDEGLKSIAACTNIISLQLNNTAVTDNGLAHLQSLEQLQSLNLVNTAITLKGVVSLNKLEKLGHIYLYKSKVLPGDYSQLKQLFPKTVIDTGGYKVASLPSDTIYLTKPINPDP